MMKLRTAHIHVLAVSLLVLAGSLGSLQAQSFVAFDVPGAVSTIPASINAQGEITGSFSDGTGSHGFVREANGSIKVFDGPGAIWTSPASINARGEITGSFSDGTGSHGFVREPKGNIIVFDVPGATSISLTMPTSINAQGEITGYFAPWNCNPSDGVKCVGRGFVRSPARCHYGIRCAGSDTGSSG